MRAAKPDALFVFYPGGPGIQFVTQYAQSGLKGQVPLYSGFTIDDLSLPRLKDLAVGNPGAHEWVSDLPNDTNKKFVADFKAKYKTSPSFYGADTYDAVALINSAVTAVKGDLSNKEGMRKEMEKADFKSVPRQLQVRQQPHPDPEFLPAGCGQECRRQLLAAHRLDDRPERPGQVPRQMPDEVRRHAPSYYRHSKVAAKRPSKDAAETPRPSPFEARASLSSGRPLRADPGSHLG